MCPSKFGFPRRSLITFIIAFIAMTVGCEGDNITNNINLPESKVQATVSGRVFSDPSGDLIRNASYELVGTGVSGTCDTLGVYSIEGLSEGTYYLLVSAAGHATTRTTISIYVDQPVQGPTKIHITRNVYLIEKTASLEVTILKPSDGQPAPGAEIELFNWDVRYGYYIEDANVPATATADTNGLVTLTDLPATSATMVVRPYDADGDGTPDFSSSHVDIDLRPNTSTQKMVVMRLISSTIEIVATNLPSYSGVVRDPVVFIVYSTIMDTGPFNTYVTMVEDNYPYDEIPVNFEWVSDIRLEISPDLDVLVRGTRCDLRVEVVSESGVWSTRSWTTTFEVGGGGSGGGDCPDVVSDLDAAASGEPFDFDTKSFLLSWTAVPCARGYHVYAKDDRDNPSWVYLKDEPNDFEYGTVTTLAELPASFDRYSSDNIMTPLAGISVTFAVVPKMAEDPDPDSGHGTDVVADETTPNIAGVTQVGSSWNISSQAITLGIPVMFSEYISPSVGDPVVEISEAGGDPSFTLDPTTGQWIWDAGGRSGRLVISVPPTKDGSGDQVRFTFQDLEDLSGNMVAGSSTSPDMALTASWFFDFEIGPQGWSDDGVPNCWEWGRPTYGLYGAYSGEYCWGTDLDANYGNDLDSRLTSPTVGVPTDSPVLRFRAWWYMYTGDVCEIFVKDGSVETKLGELIGSNREWSLVQYSLDPYAGRAVQIVFRFTSDTSSGRYGFYVDDVEVISSTP